MGIALAAGASERQPKKHGSALIAHYNLHNPHAVIHLRFQYS